MVAERETDQPEHEAERQDVEVLDATAAASDATAAAEAGAATATDETDEAEAVTKDEVDLAEDDTPERLATRLDEARARAEADRDQLLRVRAEMENLKRRQATELEKAHKFALDSFVRELLQVCDSLELGHTAALDERADITKLREGTELTLKLLVDVMGKFGVEPIDPQGMTFDPEYHQAMTMQPTADAEPNTVVSVVQKGYLLNGRLVRPAMVIVATEPAAEWS